MRPGSAIRFAAIGAALGLVLVSALTATNAVPASRAERDVSVITVDAKKPRPECNAFVVTAIFTGGAPGGGGNDLVLGTAGADDLRGNGGSDCIVGGGGNDILRGGAGSDVCIGGPGTDRFVGCETQIQ